MNKIPKSHFKYSIRRPDSGVLEFKYHLEGPRYCTVCDEKYGNWTGLYWPDEYIEIGDWIYILPIKKHPQCYELFNLNPLEYEARKANE